MATINGSVRIQAIADGEMVKIYEFKERHGGSFNFVLSTTQPNGQQGSPHIDLTWTTLAGAESIVALIKTLEAKPTA